MNIENKSLIKKRIEETSTARDRVLQIINDMYSSTWFTRKQLSTKISFISREVLKTYLNEFKREGFLKIVKKGPRYWEIKATKKLSLEIKRIHRVKNINNYYIEKIPNGCLRVRGNLRLVNRCVHLNIFSGALTERSREKICRYKALRHGRYFFITYSENGNKLIPKNQGHSVDSSIPKQLIYEDERLGLMDGKLIPVEIFLKPSEWGLKIEDFFTENRYTKELVKSLSTKYEILVLPAHNYSVGGMWRFDIMLQNAAIEITASNPKKKPGPHSTQASVIRSKILDGVLFSLEKNQKSFVVLPDSWKMKEHVRDLAKIVLKYGCVTIFTDFKDGWADKVAKEIDSFLIAD